MPTPILVSFAFPIFCFLVLTLPTNALETDSTAPPFNRRGWVEKPDRRGTFDILWNCLFTIFICTWTALHVNVPAQGDGYWVIFRRKVRWMFQGILGPELVLAFATGQRAEAQRCVAAFHADNYKQWTLRHAFYANMGGFVLQPRDSVPFPVNGKQLHYLVSKRYMELPALDEKEIWDKSKAAGFAKFVTCLQTGWLALQCICRAIQKMPMTTLELTTMSFVICTVAMYYQWLHKPLDVEKPTILQIGASTEELLVQAGEAASKPYRQTPLDFVDDQSPSWLIDVQPHLRFKTWARQRPLPRFTNDRLPVVGASPNSVLLFFVNMLYAGIHLIGWNFSFPTATERLLWRVAGVAIVVTTFILWMCETYQDGVRLGRWRRWLRHVRSPACEEADESGLGRPVPFVPMWEVILLVPVGFIYTIARAYLIVECFVGLRSLPDATFDDVRWTEFIPHF